MENNDGKFWLFRAALDFMADRSDVTSARMSDFTGGIMIEGEDTDGNVITMHISMTRKEQTDG